MTPSRSGLNTEVRFSIFPDRTAGILIPVQSDTPAEGIRCGVYVVGYFDLCGQSNGLLPYVDVNSVSRKTA